MDYLVTSFWERAANSVDHMFSSYIDYLCLFVCLFLLFFPVFVFTAGFRFWLLLIWSFHTCYLYKWWPWVELDLFHFNIKFGRLWVWMANTVTKSFKGKNLQHMTKETNDPRGAVCPFVGAIYMYVIIVFKHLLLWNHWTNQSQSLSRAS